MSGEIGQGSQYRYTVGTGRPEQERTERPENDRNDMTTKAGHPGEDSRDRTDRQDSYKLTARTGKRG